MTDTTAERTVWIDRATVRAQGLCWCCTDRTVGRLVALVQRWYGPDVEIVVLEGLVQAADLTEGRTAREVSADLYSEALAETAGDGVCQGCIFCDCWTREGR